MNKLNLIDFKGATLDALCEMILENQGADKLTTVSVSGSNSKMGEIASMSLPPVITCRENAPCRFGCYALDNIYTLRPQSMNAYNRNLYILEKIPELYYLALEYELKINRYFRLHVSGDFYKAEYFARVCELVRENPGCTVVAFTKQYEIVNEYLNTHTKPKNFKIIFSYWGKWTFENPHNLPICNVFNKGDEIPEDYIVCGGNCCECINRGVGCYVIEEGQKLALIYHGRRRIKL